VLQLAPHLAGTLESPGVIAGHGDLIPVTDLVELKSGPAIADSVFRAAYLIGGRGSVMAGRAYCRCVPWFTGQ
jgi:hypothetical protein